MEESVICGQASVLMGAWLSIQNIKSGSWRQKFMQQFSILSLLLLNCSSTPKLIKSLESNNNISLLAVFANNLSVRQWRQHGGGAKRAAVRGAILLFAAWSHWSYRVPRGVPFESRLRNQCLCSEARTLLQQQARCLLRWSQLRRTGEASARGGGLMVAPACLGVARRGAAGRRWRLESCALAVILYTAVVFALRTTSNLQLAVAPSNDRLIHKVIHQQGAVCCLVNR